MNTLRRIAVIFSILFGVIALSTGIASAHHPVVSGSAVRPCGADSAWTATFKAESDADYNKDWHSQHKLNTGAGYGAYTAYGAYVDDQVDYGPFNLGPYPATQANVRVTVHSQWRNKGGASQPVNADAETELTINRPATTTCPSTTAGVQFKDPTCADTSVAIFGYLNTDKVNYVTVGTVAAGQAVTVNATPKTGYSLTPNPTVFNHVFGNVPDCTTHVTVEVAFQDPTCENQNTAAVIGAVDTVSVDFTVTGTVAPGGHVDVTAVAKAGYTLDGTAAWSHDFPAAADCRVIVTPVAPVVTRTAICEQVDTFTTTAVTGVTYSPVSGSLPAGVVTNVTATPDAGYRFDPDVPSIVYALDGSVIEVCPTVPPTTVPPTTPPPTTVPETTTTQPPFDACLNVEGVQPEVPTGLVADGAGNCNPPPTVPTPDLTTDTLPKTGSGTTGATAIWAGIVLAMGIVLVIVAARRRKSI